MLHALTVGVEPVADLVENKADGMFIADPDLAS